MTATMGAAAIWYDAGPLSVFFGARHSQCGWQRAPRVCRAFKCVRAGRGGCAACAPTVCRHPCAVARVRVRVRLCACRVRVPTVRVRRGMAVPSSA